MIQWSEATKAIIDAHKNDFNCSTFTKFMEKAGGFSSYLHSLGGVFDAWADRNANVLTTGEFKEIAEFVFGVMAVYGFDYNNGTKYYRWGDSSRFYTGSIKGKCQWGELSELCSSKAKTTNCNYFADTLLIKAGMFSRSGFHNSCDVAGLVKAFGYEPIRKKADLRVGDLVQMYRKPITGKVENWRKNSDWYHVAVVGEIEEDSIVLYDGGSRFVTNCKYKYPIPKTGDSLGGTYANCKGWAGIRVRDLIEENGMQKVIDISEFNTVNDWAKVKGTGNHVIIRMGLRGSLNNEYRGKIREDKKFREHLAGVQKHGIPYGVYWFPTPITDEEAAEEAARIIDLVSGLKLSYPAFLDSEIVDAKNKTGRADGLTRDKRTHLLRVMCDRLEAAKVPVGIYASTYWLDNNLDMSQFSLSTKANTWVAQYASKCTYGGIYGMWQYTSKAKVNGVSDVCDCSYVTGGFVMSERKYSRKAIVDKALSYLGTSAGSTKHKQIIDAYNSYGYVHGYPRGYKMTYHDAWCATFCSSIAIQCGYTDIIPVECGCPQMITLAKKMGEWVEKDSYVPAKGDLVLYDWDDNGKGDNTGTPDHIGIVEAVSGGTITVIEGNYNDAVRRRSLAVDGKYIRGFITPKYSEETEGDTFVSVTAAHRVLRKGMKGKDVEFLQSIIGAKKDGSFGNKTEEALIAYQKGKGVSVIGQPDGICSRKTWACIIADSAK